MPRVKTGTFASATISTSQTAAALDKGASAVGTAGALTVATATPKRVSARLELRLEDIAAVGQENFESILRENLVLALSDQLDDQAINGNGTAPNLSGIFQGLADPTAAPTAVADFDAFVGAFAGGVDGLWSVGVKEVAIACGVETYRLSASTFRDPASGTEGGRGDMAFSDYGMGHYGGWWTKLADARRGNIHERRQRATSNFVPHGPVDGGRRWRDAHGCLPTLGHRRRRRHLFRVREGRTVFHHARSAWRHHHRAAERLCPSRVFR